MKTFLISVTVFAFSLGFICGSTYETRVALKAMDQVTNTATQVINDLKKRCQ